MVKAVFWREKIDQNTSDFQGEITLKITDGHVEQIPMKRI